MAFDIRAIFTRALGGRRLADAVLPRPAPEELTDEEMPDSPILAAGSAAASPDTDDMAQGGATAATLLIPEGVDAIPSAAVDDTRLGRADDEVSDDQAALVAEVAIAAAVVHGALEDDERDDLVESLREVPGLEALDENWIDDVLDQLTDTGSVEDPGEFVSAMEERVQEIAATLTDPTLRRAAYQLAVYFCAWDGALSDEETDLLEAIGEAFEITDLEARSLREATLVEAGVEGMLPPEAPAQ